MGKITTDQSHSVMSILATNTDWGAIDFDAFDLQNRIIRDPKGAGRSFMNFLKGTPRKEEKAPRPCMYSVTSDGKDPMDVPDYLEFKGFEVDSYFRNTMRSGRINTTNGKSYIIGLIFIDELPKNESSRTFSAILEEAKRRGWIIPPAEIAYLSHERINDRILNDLDLTWLITMHEPIDGARLAQLPGGKFTVASWSNPNYPLSDRNACAFLVPQILQ